MVMFVVTGHNQPESGHWWKQLNVQAFSSDLVVQHFFASRATQSLLPHMVSFSLNRSMFCTRGRADIAQLVFSWAGQRALTRQNRKFRCFPLWQHKGSFSDQPIWAFIFPKWRIMSSVWFNLYAIVIHWGTIGCLGKLGSMLENYIKWKVSCHRTFSGSAGGVWQVTSCRADVAFRPPTCTSVLDPTEQTVISSLPRQAALCRCEPGILSQGRLRPPFFLSWFQTSQPTSFSHRLRRWLTLAFWLPAYFLCMQSSFLKKCFSSLLLVIGVFFTPYNLGHTSSLSLIRRPSLALLIFFGISLEVIRVWPVEHNYHWIIFLPTFWLHFSVASFARTQTAVSWL